MIRQLRSGLIWTLTVQALLLVAASGASAQINDPDQIRTSTWDASYSGPDGNLVRHTLVFNGPTGSYVTTGGDRGRLDDVEYDIRPNNQGGWDAIMYGRWSMSGGGGSFRFDVSSRDPLNFRGRWDIPGGPSGSWNGRLTRVAAANPGAPGGGGGGGTRITISNAYSDDVVIRLVDMNGQLDYRAQVGRGQQVSNRRTPDGNLGLIIWDSRGTVVTQYIARSGDLDQLLTLDQNGRIIAAARPPMR